MRKIQYLFLLIIISSCSNLKYLNTYDSFKGNPKEVESSTFRVKINNSLVIEELGYKNIYFYDSKGRKIKSLDFKSDGTPSSSGWNYKYDVKGNLTQITLYNLDSTINVQIDKKYNRFGQPISEISKSVRKKISYNRKKRISILNAIKNDGAFHEKSIIKYDKKWRKIELKSYANSGKQKSRIEFFYNEKDNEIQSKWYNSQNKLYEYYNSTYNVNNDRIRIEKYHISNEESELVSDTKTEYKYDEKGNCIEERLISNGKTSWVTKNKFKYVW